MKYFIYIFIIFPMLCFAQVNEVEQDSLEYDYILVEGDSIATNTINLDEVMLLHKLQFNSKEDRKRYLILRRKTIKVYPYAKLAAERLQTLNERLELLEKKSDKKVYTKRIQKYIEGEFSDELKKLTRTEGQILVVLIQRQTGKTTFDLVKELRTGWRAFWYNNTAKLFDISLKTEFDPENLKEHYLIEDILQRNFQSGVLERQEPAIEFDFFELTEKWLKPNEKTALNETSK
ncbi:DUF4294 domain-containing protein [Yeosuana sp. MJ-SS3]|uniref:DUF4294 domain-containing protein n=1 Tax=Gilvirhabdus luticola TaxID=3079858 RepID=A0ABU3U9Z4_9FLAO|nr:DUF4294 domain-containing protein [Yeosuana sp. MJ-SS3]MDU8887172.1 DUF4294 domain-containing protein [Yeosuana sp. MJ-SS3]